MLLRRQKIKCYKEPFDQGGLQLGVQRHFSILHKIVAMDPVELDISHWAMGGPGGWGGGGGYLYPGGT